MKRNLTKKKWYFYRIKKFIYPVKCITKLKPNERNLNENKFKTIKYEIKLNKTTSTFCLNRKLFRKLW